jgi:hypothetical protein
LQSVDPEDTTARVRQRTAVGGQIRREEHRQQHLRELAGLDGESGDPDPDAGAVHGGEEDRQGEENEGGHDTDVGVALEYAMVAQHKHDHDEQRHAQRGPDELGGCRVIARCLQVEPVDQDEAEAVEQHADRQ